MKNYIQLLFLLLFNTIQSQNILVIDSLYHKPIPFVNIQFNKTHGTYTNENGFFEVNKNSKDTLILSHISFNNYVVKASEIKDTIILSQNAILLKEVKISKNNQIIKYIDFPRSNTSFRSWPVSSKSELVTLIVPSKENLNSIIKKLNFSFVKKKEVNSNLSIQTAIRINIYNMDKNNSINEKIYSSYAIFINPSKKEKIEINLENEFIEFSENGLYIGLEVIGDIDNSGNIIKEKSYIHAVLTDNSLNDYSCKTYIKYVFDSKTNLLLINDIIKKTSGQYINRNLSFGMTISKSN